MILSRDASGSPPAGGSSERSALGALRRAGWRRLRNAYLSLPLVVRIEIPALALACTALLAVHSDSNYFAPSPEETGATWITHGSRVLFGALLLAAFALAHAAPRLGQRSGDAEFLASTPVPETVDALWRADQVVFFALPLGLTACGLLLPPLEFGAWGSVAALVTAWLSWLWAVGHGAAWFATVAWEARWGPRGIGGVAGRLVRYLLVPLTGLGYYATRELVARAFDAQGVVSMWVTAGIGILLGSAVRAAIRGSAESVGERQTRLREFRRVLEWKRRARRASRGRLAAGTHAGSARVWWAKDARIIARTPALRWQWAAALALKLLGLWLGLHPATRFPWAFSGLLFVFGDFLAGNAILQMWAREQAGWIWGTPSPRRAQWWARVGPPLFLSVAASAVLVWWAGATAGPAVARPLALWLLVSGVSLVLAAGNLGVSSPPQTALGQNLYALGLLCALLVSAVFPVVGWAVLGLFALYTLRALALDPRG